MKRQIPEVIVEQNLKKLKDDKKGEVIALFTEKGGVGKTTVCHELSKLIKSNENKQVLIIDCDPQNNVCHLSRSPSMMKKMQDKMNLLMITDIFSKDLSKNQDEIQCYKNQWYSIILGDDIPANEMIKFEPLMEKIYSANQKIHIQDINLSTLIENLKFLRQKFDYIFLDMNPSYSAINKSLMYCTDSVLSLVTPNRMCQSSLDRLIESCRSLELNRNKIRIYIALVQVKYKQNSEDVVSYHKKNLDKLINRINMYRVHSDVNYVGILPKIDKFDNYQNNKTIALSDNINLYLEKISSIYKNVVNHNQEGNIPDDSLLFGEINFTEIEEIKDDSSDKIKIKEYLFEDKEGFFIKYKDQKFYIEDEEVSDNYKLLYYFKSKIKDTNIIFWKIGRTEDLNFRRLPVVRKTRGQIIKEKVFIGRKDFINNLENKVKSELFEYRHNTTEEFYSNDVTDIVFDIIDASDELTIDFVHEFD